MRPWLPLATILGVGLTACGPQATAPVRSTTAPTATSDLDARFAELSQRWLDGWLRLNPVTATSVGEHAYDGDVDDLSAAGRERAVAFSRQRLAELEAIDTARLTREN